MPSFIERDRRRSSSRRDATGADAARLERAEVAGGLRLLEVAEAERLAGDGDLVRVVAGDLHAHDRPAARPCAAGPWSGGTADRSPRLVATRCRSRSATRAASSARDRAGRPGRRTPAGRGGRPAGAGRGGRRAAARARRRRPRRAPRRWRPWRRPRRAGRRAARRWRRPRARRPAPSSPPCARSRAGSRRSRRRRRVAGRLELVDRQLGEEEPVVAVHRRARRAARPRSARRRCRPCRATRRRAARPTGPSRSAPGRGGRWPCRGPMRTPAAMAVASCEGGVAASGSTSGALCASASRPPWRSAATSAPMRSPGTMPKSDSAE